MKVLEGNRSVSRKAYGERSIWACERQRRGSQSKCKRLQESCDSLFSIEGLGNSRETSFENLVDRTQIVVSSHRYVPSNEHTVSASVVDCANAPEERTFLFRRFEARDEICQTTR